VGNIQLRSKLLEMTKNKTQAEVQNMKWITNDVDAERIEY
jgi:hypothetical protein